MAGSVVYCTRVDRPSWSLVNKMKKTMGGSILTSMMPGLFLSAFCRLCLESNFGMTLPMSKNTYHNNENAHKRIDGMVLFTVRELAANKQDKTTMGSSILRCMMSGLLISVFHQLCLESDFGILE